MDVRDVDLNLLVVFEALVRHRSVTAGAQAIGLSQPAMSGALARLRVLFDDPLFVRTGAEMRPTPRALELAEPVRRIMETVRVEVLQRPAFEPRDTDRTFALVTPDIGEVNFLPKILAHLAREAPAANLRALSMPRNAAAQALESGEAELAIGFFPDLQKAGFMQQKLFRLPHVCIVRDDHPTCRGDAMTLRQFLDAAHVVVRPEGREHVFEQFLQQRKLERRVLLEVSHFMSLLPIVASSDLVATVPRDLAQLFARFGPIRLVEPPFKAPAIDLYQFWHRRAHKDPANAWLRRVVHEIFAH